MPDGNRLLEELWKDVINGGLTRRWLDNLIESAVQDPDAPFADVGPAVRRMLDAGVDVHDLCRVARHERYEACFELLYKINGLDIDRDDLDVLYESLLGAEPTGNEARPGSWPINKKSPPKKSKRTQSAKLPQSAASPVLELKRANGIVFSPDGKRIAVNSTAPELRSLNTGELEAKCDMHSNTIHIAFSPDATKLAGVSTSGKLAQCNARSGKAVWKSKECDQEGSLFLFSPDGKQIVFGDWNGRLWVFNAGSGKVEMCVENPGTMIDHGVILNSGTSLVVVGTELESLRSFAAIWAWPLGQKPKSLVHPKPLKPHRVAVGPRASELTIVDGMSGPVVVVKRTTFEKLRKSTRIEAKAIACSPNGRWIGAVLEDGAALLDAKTLNVLKKWPIEYASSVAFSCDNRLIAVGSSSKGEVWEIDDLLKQ